MKVKELIAKLKELNPDLDVFMSIDDEGNGYRKLETEPSTGRINPLDLAYNRTDSFYFDEWSDQDCCLEADERKTFPRAVCL